MVSRPASPVEGQQAGPDVFGEIMAEHQAFWTFAETKEALGGYYLIEANDLDQAIAIGKACLPGSEGRRYGRS